MMITDERLTVPEIAAHLRLSQLRTYAILEECEIPYIRLSKRRIRIPRRAFESSLAKRTFRAQRHDDEPLNAA